MTPEQWTLINTLSSALIGAAIALIAIYVQARQKNKETRKDAYDTYKKYSKPIMMASESLAWRIREVLLFKGPFLLSDAPQNGFFKYKFDSTVYRLCSLIGWITAAQKEHSYLEGFHSTKNAKIRAAINSFQKVLADGGHVEVSIFEELCKLYEIEIKKISDHTRQEIGVEIERIVFEFIPDNVKKNVSTLNESAKLAMISSIMNLITNKTNQSTIDGSKIKEKLNTAVEEVAREFCWIYRDWQNAIGEQMTVRLSDSHRQFDVIGFSDFVERVRNNQWISKADNLFSNLNVSIDDRFDSRVSQVKLIYESLVELIEELNRAIKNEEAIAENSLKILKEFKNQLEKERKDS